MTWFAQTANQAEAEKSHCMIFIAADLDFPSGHVRVWGGIGEITIGGNIYNGTGTLGKVSVAPERSGLDATRKTFSLSGVDPSIIPEYEIENCYGRSVTEYFGFLNVDTRTIIAEPEINWEGRMDSVTRIDGKEPSIRVNAEHRMVLLDLADGWRFTDQHQQRFYPGDKGYDQVEPIQLKEISWGGRKVYAGLPGDWGDYRGQVPSP